jgi:polyferredoxin
MPSKTRFKNLSAYLFLIAGLVGIGISLYGLTLKPVTDIVSYLLTSIIVTILGALDYGLTRSQKYYKKSMRLTQKGRLFLSIILITLGILFLSLPLWLYPDLFFGLALIPLEIIILGHGALYLNQYLKKKRISKTSPDLTQ